MQYTPNSKLSDVYKNPVGHDMLGRVLSMLNKPEVLIKNPIVSNLKLKSLPKLSKGIIDDSFLQALLNILNAHPQSAPNTPRPDTTAWWKESIIYQVYPRSFCDSDGDGIGDIKGIISKLDYLAALGIDVLWLSPVYDSPNDDNGYDIRDYQKIMAEFGTMHDFDNLLNALHQRGMKLIMDLVVNHTSDEHKWFESALNQENSPYEQYYIWRDGEPDTPPTNWKSFFSGSAWNYYPKKKKWALHLFSKKQMDLNWDCPELRNDICKMVNWWLDKGVDGFRLDVINCISKFTPLANGSEAIGNLIGITGIENYIYGPNLHKYLSELNLNAFKPHGAVTVGETPGVGLEMARLLTHEDRNELDMVFCFDHLDNPGHNRFGDGRYDLRYLKQFFCEWQTKYKNGCWNALFFENHDNPRMVSKIDPTLEYRLPVAKLLCVLMMTLRGTPFIYQGQELGLGNTHFNSIDEIQDIESKNMYNELIKNNAKTPKQALSAINFGTRDHARTPMPWDNSPGFGFTTSTPWLKFCDDAKQYNAEQQTAVPESVLEFYRRAIFLRHATPALVYGDFVSIKTGKNTFCYKRIYNNKTYIIEINLTDTVQPRHIVNNPSIYKTMLCNYEKPEEKLCPYEAVVYKVRKSKK